MADQPARRYDFRVIPVELIDPPERAMREQMDDAFVEELADNIKRNGILQPLGVLPIGDRFRVSWGHTRLVAAILARETAVPCRVLFDAEVQEEEFKYVENNFRRNVNPMEEATWLADLLEHKYGGAIEALCKALGVKESTVNNRLDLLAFDPKIQAALRAGDIGLGVAGELNKIDADDWRAFRLKDAIEQGATERTVRDWRINDNRNYALQRAEGEGAITPTPPSTESAIANDKRCVICDSDEDQNEMSYRAVHDSCYRQLRRAQRADKRGDGQ